MMIIVYFVVLLIITITIPNESIKFKNYNKIRRYHSLNRLNSITNQIASNQIDNNIDYNVDVAVLGSGIAGSTISWLLQEQYNLSIALIDPRVNEKGTWYPNYGEWRDEWHHLSNELQLPELKECTTTEWEITDCFFGGSFNISADERTTLQRPYIRVDRIKMQELLYSRFIKSGGIAIPSKLSIQRIADNLFTNYPNENADITNPCIHLKDGTVATLDNNQRLKCKILIDSTGLESRIIARETSQYARGHPKEYSTGYQIAYGFIAQVDSLGPYDKLAMTLFDYRTDQYDGNDNRLKQVSETPTFMYTMPLGTLPNDGYRVFFEETSLVGRGDRRLTFEECKIRAFERLAYHNITIFGLEEEEYCYIPMGGELPDQNQRVIAFGGSANMVHPSTGYQACRMIASARGVANTISNGIKSQLLPDVIAKQTYRQIWSKTNRLQRDFQAFGGDFLMEQHVETLRGFFIAFFSINQPIWSGFLAGYPGLPNNHHHDNWLSRLNFALSLFFQMPWSVRIAMILFSITHTIQYGPNTLVRSLSPSIIFGDGPTDIGIQLDSVLGDVEAKQEARSMMSQFTPSAVKPGVIIEAIEEPLILPSPFNN